MPESVYGKTPKLHMTQEKWAGQKDMGCGEQLAGLEATAQAPDLEVGG